MKRRFILRSIYVKYILLFVGTVWLSSVVAFALIAPHTIDTLRKSYAVQIERKAAEIQTFCAANTVDPPQLAGLFTGDIYDVRVFADYGALQKDGTYRTLVSESQFERIKSGNTLKGSLTKSMMLPYIGVPVQSDVVFICPRIKNNLIPYFKNLLITVLLVFAGLGSCLIAAATVFIFRPLRKLTDATKEVAKGNFDVRVQTRSGDEIGKLTENFNKMAVDLKNIEYLRKDFISNVSHEFKTPITSIQGFTRLIRDKNLTRDQFDDYTGIILSESGRLSNLSTNLLRLSKLENQEIHDQFTHYLLDEQIRRAILLLEDKWSSKELELDPVLDPVSFYGDRELMQQVWINLLTNAIKFSNPKGKVQISLTRTGDRIVAEVADEGIGIPEEARGHIFEKFYKADKSRSDEGNGLGLAIVKKIVELHQGRVTFTSKEGRGTTFTVSFPYGR